MAVALRRPVHRPGEQHAQFLASTTLSEPLEWNATLLEGEVVEAVATLREQPGEDLLIYGSGALVNALLPHKLIDEYRFMIYPLVLETGKRFFTDGNPKITLTLKQTENIEHGRDDARMRVVGLDECTSPAALTAMPDPPEAETDQDASGRRSACFRARS